MNYSPDATGTDVFPHAEYHFYIVDHNDEPRHIHRRYEADAPTLEVGEEADSR